MGTSEHPGPIEGVEDRLILWQRATPRGEQTESSLAFSRRVRTRMEVAGGELLAASGGSVGASFDAMELPDVIELALGITADAATEAESLEVACAIAHGPIQRAQPQRISQSGGSQSGGTTAATGRDTGAAIDRAQLLANRAEAGETSLDESAAQQAEPTHLFVRELRAGSATGRVIDPTFDKRGCREAVRELIDAGWPVRETSSYVRLRECLHAGGARVLLSCTTAHGAIDHVARARAELAPPLVLHVARDGAGLAPLGSLAVALRRVWREIQALPLAAPARDVLERVHAGDGASRPEVSAALGVLLEAAQGTQGTQDSPSAKNATTPWLLLERARELDAPSLLVIGDLLSDAGTRLQFSMIATADEGTQAPAALSRVAPPEPVAVEGLDDDSRVRAAASILALLPVDELAQRVAELGGDSVLAIREAARALVAAGDVVHDGSRFRFRAPSRHVPGTAAIEELVLARASGLPNVAHRVLEAVCIAPIASDRALTRVVAELDGLPPEAVTAGFAQLENEGFLSDLDDLGPLETTVRFAVRAAMPPARAAELHRFVARVLLESMAAAHAEQERSTAQREPAFIDADIANHLAEGGNEAAAARALLDSATAARANGFDRVAVRLAALALKLDSSADVRERASKMAQAVGARHETDPLHDTGPPAHHTDTLNGVGAEHVSLRPLPSGPAVRESAVREALRAILARDPDAAEGALDTAVTMGLGRAAAGRLSAIAQLAKGDIPEAVRVLKRALSSNSAATSCKQGLTAALILLEAGRPLDAMRSALEALAFARRAGEMRGEHAALFVLGGCFRQVGRAGEAKRIESRAAAPAPA